MTTDLFWQLFALITYAVVLTMALTWVLFHFFLKKTVETQNEIMHQFIDDSDELTQPSDPSVLDYRDFPRSGI